MKSLPWPFFALILSGALMKAIRPNPNKEGKLLSLASCWIAGGYKPSKGWRPEYQIRLIEHKDIIF